MGLIRKITDPAWKAKAIIQGKIKDIEEKRKGFYQELDKVKLKSNSLELADEFETFMSTIISDCTLLVSVCQKQLKNDGKSKSDPYLQSIIVRTTDLKDVLRLVKWENISPTLLNSVHKNFKKLEEECVKISKASFAVTIGAVLDYKKTRDKFLSLNKQLLNTEKLFADSVAIIGISNFLNKFKSLPNEKEKFFEQNSRILITLYFPLPNRKYEQLEFDLNFNLRGTLKEKLSYLYKKIESLFKTSTKKGYASYSEDFKNLLREIRKLIDTSEDENEECGICLEKMDVLAEKIVQLPCNHSFHKDCIRKWLKKSLACPLCKQNINKKVLKEILGKK